MTGITTKHAKDLLDWSLGGATPTQPAAHAIGLSLGTPTLISASEMATGEGVTRQTVVFPAAASPAGSASNSGALTFGPFSSARVVQGLDIFDNMSSGSGNALWFGMLATTRSLGVGDSMIFNPGSLVLTMA